MKRKGHESEWVRKSRAAANPSLAFGKMGDREKKIENTKKEKYSL